MERLRLLPHAAHDDEPEEVERPTQVDGRAKCTPELVERFCMLIRRGLPADAACDLLSINSASYYRWRRRGELYLNGRVSDRHKTDEPFAYFVQQYKKAFALYRLHLNKRLHHRRNKDWYREMAILERRDRRSFGRYEPAGGAPEDFSPDETFL